MADINTIADQIQGLTLLEASQLVKLLEEKLGVSAAAAAVAAAPAAGGGAAAAADTPNASSIFFTRSEASSSVKPLISSRIDSTLLAIAVTSSSN